MTPCAQGRCEHTKPANDGHSERLHYTNKHWVMVDMGVDCDRDTAGNPCNRAERL